MTQTQNIMLSILTTKTQKRQSHKFKTNELDKVIDLHKAKFHNDLTEENVLVAWEDNPSKQPGCKAILTLRKSSKKKLFAMYFYHTESVLGLGEYGSYYHETVFPNIIKKLASDYLDEDMGKLDRETEVTSHTEGAQSSPSTPKRLQEVLTEKLNKLKDTPISPQGIMRNHLVKTNVRIDNLEQSVIDVRETQNQQLDVL